MLREAELLVGHSTHALLSSLLLPFLSFLAMQHSDDSNNQYRLSVPKHCHLPYKISMLGE